MTGLGASDIMVGHVPSGASKCVVSGIPIAIPRKEMQHIRWGRNGKMIIYTKKKSFFTIPVEGGEPEILDSGLLLGEQLQLSPDGEHISFVCDSDLWVKPVGAREPRRLTEGEDMLSKPKDYLSPSPAWPKWSPDGTKIAFLSTKRVRGAAARMGVVSVKDGGLSWVAPGDDIEYDPVWSPDSKRIALTRMSWDYKRRELLVSNVSGDEVERIWEDRDDRWVARESFGASWSPDSSKLAFMSNRSGWNHLYVSQLDGREAETLTGGSYDVIFDWRGASARLWSPDCSEIAFISNRGSLQESSIWIMPSAGGEARRLQNQRGICTGFKWSPDGKYISFIHSGPSQMPGLWIAERSGQSEPVQLYSSLADGMTEKDVADIKTVRYRSTDGASIPAVLWVPKDLRKGEKYPAIIYVYGTRGQLAYLGWGQDSMHLILNYLVQRGYVVLVVDPRGSWGYGKEFEVAIHNDLGGKHVDDVVCGAKYLADVGYVDPDKIGITGRSAGGYMTLMNLIRAPDVYAAAVEFVGVTDLKMQYEYYLDIPGVLWFARMGLPEEQAELYYDRSPINHVDKIKTPLLMFAGTEDFNVPVRHAEVLITALVKAGKEFESMIYPGEPHSWNKVETWIDTIKRIEKFFDKHLKQTA